MRLPLILVLIPGFGCILAKNLENPEECNYSNTYGEAQKSCHGKIFDFTKRMQNIEEQNLNSTTGRLEFLKARCGEITQCRSENPCLPYNPATLEQVEIQCENLELYVSLVPKCLVTVVRNIYNTSCYEDLVTDNGKSCFMNTVTQICNSSAIDYISENYDKIMQLFSDKNQDNCGTLHNAINKLQCVPIVEDLFLKSKVLNDSSSPEEKAEVIRLCNENVNCLANSCSTESYKFKMLCRGFELGDSRLWKCADSYSRSHECFLTKCTDINAKKDCLRKMIDEKCPGESQSDVEEYLEVSTKSWLLCPH